MQRMYLEEFDGHRAIIVADGDPIEGHWWQDDAEYFGVDLNDGSLCEVADRIRSVVSDPVEAIESFKTEDRFNPAWDRFESLDRAERHEMGMIAEEVPCEYIEIFCVE